MQGRFEDGWDCTLSCCFGDVALWVTPVGSRVVSLHEFGEIQCKVARWVLGVMLMVEPIVSFWGDESE